MNQTNCDIIELDKDYSTTRRLIEADPKEIESLVKQSNKPEDKFETVLFLPEGEGRQGEGGLRTKGYFKVGGVIGEYVVIPAKAGISEHNRHSSEGGNLASPLTEENPSPETKPLITVVTVVYNGEQFLEETILSVINQTYVNVEYMIIDGGSTDGTVDIIKKYEHAIDYWVSEKDKGIYDAMNKGIDLATGEWINFMNAGDQLTQFNTLSNIDFNAYRNNSLLYGNVDLFSEDKDFIKTLKALPMNRMTLITFGMRVACHQSVLYNIKHKKIKYPSQFKLKSELYSLFEYLELGCAKKINVTISKFMLGGMGTQYREQNNRELWKVLEQKAGWFKAFYFPMFLYQKIRNIKF